MGYTSTTELVANTEREILASAFDLEPEDLPGYIPDDDGEDLEAVESWDGSPLSDEEQFETAINGHTESGFDRPLQLAESEGYEREIAARDEAIATMQQQLGELQQRADPGLQQRMAQQREELMYGVVANPERAIEYVSSLEGQLAAMQASRVNASLGAAHRDYGRDFEAAYKNLTSMDRNNPAARNLVQSIWDDPEPGKALMDWHQVSGGHTPRAMGAGARQGTIPSLNSGTPASYRGERSSASRGRSDGWPVGEDDGGYADEFSERDIMQSAFR
jgi:hypothetical protein